MADISSIAAPQVPILSPGLDASSKKDTPEKIEQAAKQFESLLIAQLLKSSHEAGSKGWLGEEDESSECASEMAEEQFAQALANGGGLGLSRMIVQGLTRSSEASDTPAAPSVARGSKP
jgi:flagellar protein FlgJ